MATLIANTRTINLIAALGATVQFHRLGEAVWEPGPPLYQDTGRNQSRGKLIMLEPGTDYEVLLTEGGVSTPWAVTTRSEVIPKLPGGRNLEADPSTLTTALLSGLLPGDTLSLRGGLYRLPAGLDIGVSGDQDNYITIQAYPGEEAVLTADPGTPLAWTSYSGPVWQAPVGGKVDQVWEGDRLLWKYGYLTNLVSLAKGLPGGYYHDKTAGVLYIRTPDDGDPTGREWHITQQGPSYAGQGHALRVTGSYIELKGLKARWVSIPILLKGRGIVVDECEAYATHYMAVTGTGAARCIVRNCQADGGPGYEAYRRGLYGANWAHGRGIWFKQNAESFEAYGNTWQHLVEGISGFTSGQDSNMLVNPNVDIHGNVSSYMYDDGMAEIDGAGVNFGCWGNSVSLSYDGISLAPLKAGPAYVFKNTFTDMVKRKNDGTFESGTGLKIGDGSYGLCYFFHNTIYLSRFPGSGGSNGISHWASGRQPDFRCWNNIIYASRYCVAAGSSTFLADYDLLWSIDPTGRFWGNGVTASDLAGLQRKGLEVHGIQADPGFASPPENLTPTQGINMGASGVIDFKFIDSATGQVVVSDPLDVSYFERALGFTGAAPDMGAIEVGGPVPEPTARFTAEPVTGTAPLDVQITDTSLGTVYNRTWEFGDGSPASNETNPLHRFSSAGTFRITLVVMGPGGSDSAVLDIIVLPIGAPEARFSASSTQGVAPFSVQFTDQSLWGGGISSRTWNYGDGTSPEVYLTPTNPVHIFANSGAYTVTLTVAGPGGSSSAQMGITALVVPPLPLALFDVDQAEGPSPLTVRFTNRSTDADSAFWEFGDGATSTEWSPRHTYTVPGDYTPRLTVTGPGGTDAEAVTVTVLEPVVPSVPVGKILAAGSLFALLVAALRKR